MTLPPQHGMPSPVPGPGQPAAVQFPQGVQQPVQGGFPAQQGFPGQQPAGPVFLKHGASAGSTTANDDVPWIVSTRLAPGQRIRRSVLWGIITYVMTALHLIMAVVGYGSIASTEPTMFFATLPWWGICSLGLLAGVVGSFVKRGTFNIVAAVIGLLTLVITNPVIPISIVALFA